MCSCAQGQPVASLVQADVITGADQWDILLPMIHNKRVGVIANQTSLVKQTHLVDTLVKSEVNLIQIFSPEHGFRGNHSAGEWVDNMHDEKTGIPIVSLYGGKKAPTKDDLKDIQILIFDVQDVGARFYTYLSTLYYTMYALKGSDIQLIILDRPNPNGHYIDGPVLDTAFRSMVGVIPIPIVHGCTLGELACMMVGEGWVPNVNLKVVPCLNYSHNTLYSPPVPPSPNLPNYSSIQFYPSLCLFEGTFISVGRGTPFPFELIGCPKWLQGDTSFVPVSIPNKAASPPFENEKCNGLSLVNKRGTLPLYHLDLSYLLRAYQQFGPSLFSHTAFFDKLAGNVTLREMILNNISEQEIRKSWEKDLNNFKGIRNKYLLYP